MAEAKPNPVNVLPKDIDYSGTRSLFLFRHDHPVRVKCIEIASHSLFLNGVMFLIGLNCLFLCFSDPVSEINYCASGDGVIDCLSVADNTTYVPQPSWGNDVNKHADWPLLLLFTLEMLIKFIAMGVCIGPDT